MSERISEGIKIDCLPIAVTSASSNFSPAIPIKGNQSVMFVVSMGTAAAGTGGTITAYQGSATNAATTSAAAITGATGSFNSTVANTVNLARTAIINVSTATTDNETITINGLAFNYVSTGTGTALNFGATAGASAAAGVAIAMLATMVNRQLPKLTATTGTSWLNLSVKDGESTYITAVSTGGGLTPQHITGQSIIEVMCAGLNSTSDHVSVLVSSATTAVRGHIMAIRKADVKPARVHGQIVNDVNT